MDPLKLHILGCGCAFPTPEHNPAAQILSYHGLNYLIDCGEGTQLALKKNHIRLHRIEAIFITHIHGDHCLGLPGLLCTMAMLGRTRELYIIGSAQLIEILQIQIRTFCPFIEYPIHFITPSDKEKKLIYQDDYIQVYCIPLIHTVPCTGYLFITKNQKPHIDTDAVKRLGIPHTRLQGIKNGDGWTSEDGTFYPHQSLTHPATPPKSYAYCSDTRYMPDLHHMITGVDLLYHESTYCRNDIENAAKYMHSTAAQAAMVARDAHAGRLLLGHYSSKYEDLTPILDEAKSVFAQSILAQEGMIIDI